MPDTTITLTEGCIKGGEETTLNGFKYNYYLSIPYAKPPVGKLRFKNPEPVEKWTGIRDATVQGPRNPQIDLYFDKLLKGNEDSLCLNVYTPSSASNTSKLPVIVLIHGGGFYAGSGDYVAYHPDQFVSKGVVLVTMNYRLAALGFLCLHTSEAPGNVGFKDQVFALRWVQKNIKVFGGDPQNVTLNGESAGAACVQYHMMSPMSKGLFAKTIIQSGSCVANWAVQDEPEKIAFDLGEKLGIKTTDKNELLKYLRSVSAEEIVEASKINFCHNTDVVFCGVVEKSYPNCEAFILEPVLKTITSGKYNVVPCIQGFNSHEGLFMTYETLTNGIENSSFLTLENLKELIKRHLGIDASTEQAQKMHSYYLDKDVLQGFVDLVSDLFFVRCTLKSVEIMSRHNKSVYQYYFCFEGLLNTLKASTFNLKNGASHDDEKQFLYGGKDNEAKASPNDLKVMKMLSTMWTNFAKFGNPTPEIDDVIKVIWTPVNMNKSENILKINDDMEMITNPFKDRMKFWMELFGKI